MGRDSKTGAPTGCPAARFFSHRLGASHRGIAAFPKQNDSNIDLSCQRGGSDIVRSGRIHSVTLRGKVIYSNAIDPDQPIDAGRVVR